MTTYGTIPTSPESTLDFISRAKQRGGSVIAIGRTWKQLIHRTAFSIPSSIGESTLRIRTNADYFLMNYVLIVLVIVFVSLLWYPISLIVFIVMMAIWLFLYFLRDEPLVIFHRTIGDRVVLAVLVVVTLVALLLAGAILNILVSLLIGLAIVVVHAAFRKTEDLFTDEEAAGSGGLYSVVEGIKRTADEPSSSS